MNVSTNAAVFAAAAKAAAYAATDDPCKPAIAGTRLAYSGGRLVLTATDSYCLHEVSVAANGEGDSLPVLVDSKTLSTVAAQAAKLAKSRGGQGDIVLVLPGVDDVAETVSVTVGGLSAGDIPCRSSLAYPEIGRLFDDDHTVEPGALFDPEIMESVFAGASVVAKLGRVKVGKSPAVPAPVVVDSLRTCRAANFRVDTPSVTFRAAVMPRKG